MMKRDWIPARQLNPFFRRFSRQELGAIARGVAEESRCLGMSYTDDDGTDRLIFVPPRPWLFTAHQHRVFYRLCWALRAALDRVIELYVASPEARSLLPLEPDEARWFRMVNGRGLQRPQMALTRLDATATFDHARWETDFVFLESNSVGIGGIHYIPAAAEVIERVVVPRLISVGTTWALAAQPDLRQLCYRELLWFARRAGHRIRHLAFVENHDYTEGTSEFPRLVEYFRARGIQAHHADPRDFHLRRGRLHLDGAPIDLVYRDSELRELTDMERRGCRLTAFKTAFKENRVVSTIGGEFDHKSCFEVLTSPRFARHFSPDQRRIIRRHVLWTRLARQTNTEGPDGRLIDLLPYARAHRDRLVIKPNRAYGGTDVLIGQGASRREWDRRLDEIAKHPGQDVIQLAARTHEDEFPVIDLDGRLRFERYFCVSGFAVTHGGIAFLGRCNKRRVVNVAQQGGLVPVLMVR